MQMRRKISGITGLKFTECVATVIFFFIDGVNATIRVAIRPPVVEWEERHLKNESNIGKT